MRKVAAVSVTGSFVAVLALVGLLAGVAYAARATTADPSTTVAGSPAGAGSAASAAAAAATAAASAGAVVPPIPSVPPADTDGQSAAALLARALRLVSGQQHDTVKVDALSQLTARLDVDTITAQRAADAAKTATTRGAAAAQRYTEAEESYAHLKVELQQTAVRMYETGSMGITPQVTLGQSDELAWSEVYADATVNPGGLLAQRALQAKEAKSAAAEARRQRATAVSLAAKAAAAVNGERATQAQLKLELAAEGGASAAAIGTERTDVAQQAGKYALAPTVLGLSAKGNVAPQVSTTSVALEWAFAELGKPYVWGGVGPVNFDCSGLTKYVWHAAGVQIPRVAADQDTWAIPVPLAQLLPGDLVFYGLTDIHHVGIYIGDGLMINAPHTGAVVSVSSIWWSDLNGFGRVHAPGTPVPPHMDPTPTAPAPPSVVPGPGPVPSQSKPPPGWVPAPGGSAPMPGFVFAPGRPSASTSTTSVSPSSTTTSTSTTTLPDSGATTTTSTSTTSTSTTDTTTPDTSIPDTSTSDPSVTDPTSTDPSTTTSSTTVPIWP